MRRMNLRRTLSSALFVLTGGPILATSALAQSQGGYGMGSGGMMGDYGPQSNVNLRAEQRGKSWRNGYGMSGK